MNSRDLKLWNWIVIRNSFVVIQNLLKLFRNADLSIAQLIEYDIDFVETLICFFDDDFIDRKKKWLWFELLKKLFFSIIFKRKNDRSAKNSKIEKPLLLKKFAIFRQFDDSPILPKFVKKIDWFFLPRIFVQII